MSSVNSSYRTSIGTGIAEPPSDLLRDEYSPADRV